MGWISGTLVYIITWWLVFFCVLPWGNRPQEEPEVGHATSAPANPRLWMKAAITSGIAAVIFTVLWFVADAGLINFRAN
jgi:predicted secreted protein